MKAIELFEMGGTPYMCAVSVCGLLSLFYIVKTTLNFVRKNYSNRGLDLILLFGSLAVVVGLLSQAIGMYEAFGVIHSVGDISPSLMAAGFQISMITTLYGSFFFVISLLAWGILREIYKRQANN